MDRISVPDGQLTLASASDIRRQLLETAGLRPTIRPARIDEAAIRDALLAEDAHPRDVADALAEFKARKVAEAGLTLGCDQVLALKTEVFEKPESREMAKEQLSRLSGQTHHLYSAAVIYDGTEPAWRHVGVARMTMHVLTAAEIDAYLDLAWPEVASSVGAYQAESIGARLFSRMDGDWFSVLGLPLLDICSFLRLRGWSFT
ncbi:septum formation protein Maf [Rhodobacterales bacterium HKCCSP123]|nr:septum formation protein Maf [Rhodobacterales bacterium HKCCSP123]